MNCFERKINECSNEVLTFLFIAYLTTLPAVHICIFMNNGVISDDEFERV